MRLLSIADSFRTAINKRRLKKAGEIVKKHASFSRTHELDKHHFWEWAKNSSVADLRGSLRTIIAYELRTHSKTMGPNDLQFWQHSRGRLDNMTFEELSFLVLKLEERSARLSNK